MGKEYEKVGSGSWGLYKEKKSGNEGTIVLSIIAFVVFIAIVT